MERQFPAGIMPDFRQQLPSGLAEQYGKWTAHEHLAPGVLRHMTADGTECITVRVQMPPNGLVAASTLRLFARWTREYALTTRRTSRQAFELVGVRREKLEALLAEITAAGYPVGGTGNSLHQLKGCNGFLHCQNAAIDPPSIMKRLGDAFYDDIVAWRYPAPLKLSVSGCPNHCGAALEGDIGIIGHFPDAPVVNDEQIAAAPPDFGLLCRWCPVGAIKVKHVEEGRSVTILEDRCIRCTSCAIVAPDGIQMGPRREAAIAIGGRGPSSDGMPRFATVAIAGLPATVPDYKEIVYGVRAIVHAWVAGARPGERLWRYIERLGWNEFLGEVRADLEASGTILVPREEGK